MPHHQVEQNTDEWRLLRVGSLGASAVHEVVAKTKSGYSASRANKMAALIVERLTGRPQDTYQNAAMLAGIEREPQAREEYAFQEGVTVEPAGLWTHPKIKFTHASPDGLVGNDGLVEIKSPQHAAHLDVLLGNSVPDRYLIQMQWQLRCTDRQWCDFVSYNPDFPEGMKLWIKRVTRDDARIAALETEVIAFLKELDGKYKTLMDSFAAKGKAA